MFHRTFIIFGSDFATEFQFSLEMLYIIFSMRNTLFTTDYTAKQMTSATLAVSLRKSLRKHNVMLKIINLRGFSFAG